MDEPQGRVVLLPGDGVGPEVLEAAVAVLGRVAPDLRLETHPFGGAAIDEAGDPLPRATIDACRGADAVLLGAVGGPRWDAAPRRPEAGLLRLRRDLGLFANLRPVRPLAEVAGEVSPLRPSALEGVDLLVVRELTGGLYFGEPRGREQRGGQDRAVDTATYSSSEVRRVARVAFEAARRRRGKVTSVDKANVLETSRLWRDVVEEEHASFEDVALEHQLVDAAAMRLLTHARDFDVILTGNMFGDILSDESSVLAGSIGLLGSASLGEGHKGLFEPIHGSAPDIAGAGIANPVGAIVSAAMMLEYSLGRSDAARKIEKAVEAALREGARTRDLGGTSTTPEMTQAIVARLERQP